MSVLFRWTAKYSLFSIMSILTNIMLQFLSFNQVFTQIFSVRHGYLMLKQIKLFWLRLILIQMKAFSIVIGKFCLCFPRILSDRESMLQLKKLAFYLFVSNKSFILLLALHGLCEITRKSSQTSKLSKNLIEFGPKFYLFLSNDASMQNYQYLPNYLLSYQYQSYLHSWNLILLLLNTYYS